MDEFLHFSFHCQYGYLSEGLRAYLSSLEVPCPKFLKTFEVSPPWMDRDNYNLQQTIMHFFRTLSREVGVIIKTSIYRWIL